MSPVELTLLMAYLLIALGFAARLVRCNHFQVWYDVGFALFLGLLWPIRLLFLLGSWLGDV